MSGAASCQGLLDVTTTHERFSFVLGKDESRKTLSGALGFLLSCPFSPLPLFDFLGRLNTYRCLVDDGVARCLLVEEPEGPADTEKIVPAAITIMSKYTKEKKRMIKYCAAAAFFIYILIPISRCDIAWRTVGKTTGSAICATYLNVIRIRCWVGDKAQFAAYSERIYSCADKKRSHADTHCLTS